MDKIKPDNGKLTPIEQGAFIRNLAQAYMGSEGSFNAAEREELKKIIQTLCPDVDSKTLKIGNVGINYTIADNEAGINSKSEFRPKYYQTTFSNGKDERVIKVADDQLKDGVARNLDAPSAAKFAFVVLEQTLDGLADRETSEAGKPKKLLEDSLKDALQGKIKGRDKHSKAALENANKIFNDSGLKYNKEHDILEATSGLPNQGNSNNRHVTKGAQK